MGNTAKQCRLGLFQDSDFAGDLEDSKSTSGGTLCTFGSHTFVPISWMCKKQTSVSHSSTESEIISLDAGLRLDGIPALDLWDLIVLVLGNTTQNHDRTWQPVVTKITGQTSDLKEFSTFWTIMILFTQTSNFRIKKLCCMCLLTTKQWSRWSKREEAPHWDMFPEPTELLLIGCLTGSIWTSKIQIKYIDTRNQLADWPRETSHVIDGIIFCVCSILAISVLQEHKKMQVKKESKQNQTRWWIWSHDTVWGIRTCLPRLHLKTRKTPNLNVRTYLWTRSMCSKQVRGEPYMTSLSSMMILTLTPPQNRTFL